MAVEESRLQAALVKHLPPYCYYIPDFITNEEEQDILDAVYTTPSKHWTVLSHRRLLSLPSPLTGSKRDTLLDASLPAFLLRPITERFQDLRIFQDSPHGGPNHCLVNEYHPGHGIMPHEDGPAYHPITATVSLGSHTVLNVYKKNENGERDVTPNWRVLQEPRSLLVTTSDMYRDTLHGIEELDIDTSLDSEAVANWELLGDQSVFATGQATRRSRVSLTYRDVLKISKVGGALKFMTRR